jgi:two-component system sensor histidine kinase TorS
VVDRGPGIPAGEDEAIFTAFHRLADRRSSDPTVPAGSGLGLSIARTMCRDMGFDLVVDSIPGEGSTFSVLLAPGVPHPIHPLGCSVD